MANPLNPQVADLVVAPFDRTESNPPISFGGGAKDNSGTGIFGTYGAIKMAVSGVQAMAVDANGLNVGAVASSVYIFIGAGAPVDGTTGDNFAGTGSLYINVTDGELYINTGLISAPTWVLVGSQT